ncbi:dihydrolipoyl dehydrogenase family protein [Enterococcus gilvus]|uniref:Pyridine nucleotide-disulfide oxidoreductase n=1 Tax=Enterococcus gilvus ATCC BAA-350 TaxID=1158614 RepID=R2V7F1_9ENTE|nr:NAD(P)/FAD-dependent oxidoreductase [Enterococcus gilvus]EOI53621.1 hypothetical protein UKC_03573 [Enterococcus gilvus ATCC BAA-350]EOW81104.1 hypothetical protein I592_00389 [Enterococcus gilvus ATCC BAA-350]OJG42939.1 hypothetical protein RV02_GL003407 [Enterococcus gilvus]
MTVDVIVIGSGIAGLTAAFGLAKAGKQVAVVESTAFGGVVYNAGSTRKKELVTLAQHALQNQRLEQQGITTPVQLDWNNAMNWIDSMENTEDMRHQLSLKEAGISTIYGEAVFCSPHEIKVDGITYTAEQFVIATGAEDRPFTFEGQEYVSNSGDFLTQKDLPEEVLLIGAGIISFAFATIATAFGCKVRILQHNERALKDFDQEFVEELIEINKKRSVQFDFNETVEKILPTDSGELIVHTTSGHMFNTQKVYNVAGRIPRIQQLSLDKAGVNYGDHGILTNDYLQTNQPHIFACGDCSNAAVPKLATFASYQAEYLVSHLVNKNLAPIKYPLAAMSIFSEPRIAQVGVTTKEALAAPEEFRIEEIDRSGWLDSKRKAESIAFLKLVIRRSDDRIVGAAALSQEADVLINEITMVLHAGWTKAELKKQILAYPSPAGELTRFWK